MYVRCTEKLKGGGMAKTVNLTVRVSAELKQQAEAAAGYLDLSLSQVVRDAFKSVIDRANNQAITRENFKRRFAEYGVDAPTMTPAQDAEMTEHGIDTRNLSKGQRQSLVRAARSGKLGNPKPMRSLKDDMLDNINRMEANGQITKERAAEMRAGFEGGE